MMNSLELRVKITPDNLLDSDIRDLLYDAFGYYKVLSHEEELKVAFPDLLEATSRMKERGLGRDGTFAENRIPDFRNDISSEIKGTNTEKLLYLAHQLRYYHCVNECPSALLDVIAPEFFKIFPHGEIWFVELSETTQSKIWDDENKLLMNCSLDFQKGRSPHDMSGLEGGVSIFYWLSLMMYCFYPFVNGLIVTPDARLIFLFFPDQAINSFKEYKFDLYREMEFNYINVYSDSMNASRGVRSCFPEKATFLSKTGCYFEWYIHRCNELLNEIIAIEDLKKRFLITLTLNRLAVDMSMIEITELPYLTKLLFFGMLDKFANLYIQLGLESKENETKVWKTFLTKGFYENQVKNALLKIPGQVGEIMTHNAEWIFGELEDFGPSPEIARELRNSYHGYGINNIDMLIGHSGEMNNDMTGLSNILWQWLLSNGLPKESIIL